MMKASYPEVAPRSRGGDNGAGRRMLYNGVVGARRRGDRGGACRRVSGAPAGVPRQLRGEVRRWFSPSGLVCVTSLGRNDSPIRAIARTRYVQVSTAFRGTKFAIEVGSTSRPKSHSRAVNPPATRRYLRAEYENLDCARAA